MDNKMHGNSKTTKVYQNGKLIATVSSAAEAAQLVGISPAYVCMLKRNGGSTINGYSFK